MVTFGDKTTTLVKTRKQVARKTLARKAPEPRGRLKPLWNIRPDGTITNYSPTTITFDTNNRKNTVIRKNDLATINESKPRLMQFVACKTVREYNRNQDKIKQFLLTERRQAKQEQLKAQINTAASTSESPPPTGEKNTRRRHKLNIQHQQTRTLQSLLRTKTAHTKETTKKEKTTYKKTNKTKQRV